MQTKFKAKSAAHQGFISYTQKYATNTNQDVVGENLNSRSSKTLLNTEKGITLIALIIMVILLIILAMVSIKAVTGKEGILASSTTVANQYVIEQYREQIEQLVQSIILKDSLLRKNNNNKKHGRRNGKRRLDKKCSAK